jgi:hypothetical protein
MDDLALSVTFTIIYTLLFSIWILQRNHLCLAFELRKIDPHNYADGREMKPSRVFESHGKHYHETSNGSTVFVQSSTF